MMLRKTIRETFATRINSLASMRPQHDAAENVEQGPGMGMFMELQ